MRAVSRSLSIVAQVQGISEGAIYDTERWMMRRPEEEEFRAAAPAAWEETRERWMVRRPEEEFRAVAPAAWEEIRSILADFLYETATRMEEDSRRRNTTVPSNGSTPATQPREVSCPVCFANLPTIALRLCGHTLCRPCSNRVGDRCPTCRELIVGRFTIYLPSRRMSTSSLDRFLYWIMFNLGTIRSADVPKPHPGPHRLTASHNKLYGKATGFSTHAIFLKL
ncbi:hypothetical protein J6590_087636 [Homalodisca vitripennis]|nr:hypothetical protein J6590_087636 [Homalodisca vitripennis]